MKTDISINSVSARTHFRNITYKILQWHWILGISVIVIIISVVIYRGGISKPTIALISGAIAFACLLAAINVLSSVKIPLPVVEPNIDPAHRNDLDIPSDWSYCDISYISSGASCATDRLSVEDMSIVDTVDPKTSEIASILKRIYPNLTIMTRVYLKIGLSCIEMDAFIKEKKCGIKLVDTLTLEHHRIRQFCATQGVRVIFVRRECSNMKSFVEAEMSAAM